MKTVKTGLAGCKNRLRRPAVPVIHVFALFHPLDLWGGSWRVEYRRIGGWGVCRA